MELTAPKSNKAEVLYALIKYGSVSLIDFPFLASFRTRISEYNNQHGLSLTRKPQTKFNKFGNQFTYFEHYLPAEQKYKALEIYNEINA